MSKLKITGNSNPIVGELEKYSVDDFFQKFNLHQNTISENHSSNVFDNQIKWSIWILDKGSWRKTKENDKTGATVNYTFHQKSLTRKGIKMLVEANGEKDILDITPKPANQAKIIKVDLLDADFSKPTRPFAYGDSVIARVHCVDMERFPLLVTLWEDDSPGAGHNKANTFIKSQKGTVLNGKADVEFYLDPSISWLANARLAQGDKNEGANHEYYVTAEVFEKVPIKKVASSNTNVPNPDYKPEITKPKPPSPASQKEPSKKDKKEINKSEQKVHDYHEQKVTVQNKIVFNPINPINSLMKVNMDPNWWKKKEENCGEKYCIKKGDKNELIREINIRLAGFGGNVPTDEFTDRTEKMIKQFQRDYMQVPETGKVCGNVLKAIDEFCGKWSENIVKYKCLCHASDSKVSVKDRCNGGYGIGLKDEHPGIHRSLLWSVSALKYYLSLQKKYTFYNISAGYRCWAHNKSIPRTSTNHMGKAVDIQFRVDNVAITGKDEKNIKKLESIRDSFYVKFLKAQQGWSVKDEVFRLEPIGLGKDQSYSWIHMDVTKFNNYLEDKYFVKQQKDIEGDKLVKKAFDLKLNNLCNCGGFKSNDKQKPQEKYKYKWSHSEFGNLIATNESKDNYNICNKTKGGLKIVNDVDVINTTIRDIISKQASRDIFAVGRYQLIPITLNAAIESLSLDLNSKLNAETQDKIFDEYLIKIKRPDIINYLEGDSSLNSAMYASAKEWASIGVEKGNRISDQKIKVGEKITYKKRYAKGGESYYAGDGLNKAHVTPEEIKNVLINSKNNYK